MGYNDRFVAWKTFLPTYRTNKNTLTTTMASVATNSISAQNITDINAAIVALDAAVTTAAPAFTKPDSDP